MKAILLAAGRGERMRPLTDALPKALLLANGKPLIAWHLEKLAAAGFKEIIINHAHFGEAIERVLGDGHRFDLHISYSRERTALETAGGIANALPLLGSAPFAAINADVFSDYDYGRLWTTGAQLTRENFLAHLILVNNPDHNVAGDFALHGGRVVLVGHKLTFSGIAVYRPEMYADLQRGVRASLAPLLIKYAGRGEIRGEHFSGQWRDIGTPERLALLNRELTSSTPAAVPRL